LGRKGYEQLADYLIPVIHLIKSGAKHTDAFRQIAKKLSVANSTVSAECTRSLNISTEEFIELVKSNRIKSFLKDRFPNRASLIEQEL
jgi:IS30 family transposase